MSTTCPSCKGQQTYTVQTLTKQNKWRLSYWCEVCSHGYYLPKMRERNND
jgi:hypothetical protein